MDGFVDQEAKIKIKREEMTSDREEMGGGAVLEQRGNALRSHTVHHRSLRQLLTVCLQ